MESDFTMEKSNCVTTEGSDSATGGGFVDESNSTTETESNSAKEEN